MILFKYIYRLLFRKKNIVEDDDLFGRDSEQGFNMFPGLKPNIMRLRIKLRLLIIRSVWIALSLPLKVLAISGCIAAFSGSAILIHKTTAHNQQTIPENTKEKNIQYSVNTDVNEQSTENPLSEQDEPKAIHYYNNQIIQQPMNQMQLITISKQCIMNIDTENDIIASYSTFPDMYFYSYRFVDFSKIFPKKTSIILPVFSGLEARFENRESVNILESCLISDTVAYYDFLERIALHLSQQQFNEAEHLLMLLINQKPADENGLFYLGYVYFMKGKHQKALTCFEKCKQTPYRTFYTEACEFEKLIKPDSDVSVDSPMQQQ